MLASRARGARGTGLRRAGFNLIELVLVVALAALAAAALFWRYNDGITRAVAHAAGAKAGELFGAMASGTQGGGSASPALLSGTNFATSTALFRCALERHRWGAFGYEDLVAGGVPVGQPGAFSATNNIWTIAVNVPDASPASLPLLISRNVDLTPLRGAPWGEVAAQPIAYDEAWGAPLHDWGFVCIRRSGSVFVSRRATYGDLFPDGLPTNRCAGGAALTYLTPTRAIAVGE